MFPLAVANLDVLLIDDEQIVCCLCCHLANENNKSYEPHLQHTSIPKLDFCESKFDII